MTLPSWYTLARKVPGMSGRMWALLDHMADLPEHERGPRTGAHIGAGAKFSITSDGFAMVTFHDGRGTCHHGAFWGPWSENVANVRGLADHMERNGGRAGWNPDHSAAMVAALLATIGQDYRPAAAREPLPDGFRVRKVAKGRARAPRGAAIN